MSAPKQTFRVGTNGRCIVTDNVLLPTMVEDSADPDIYTYGGRMIAENIHPDMAHKIAAILNAAVDPDPTRLERSELVTQPKDPTLEERNAAVRERWEKMSKTPFVYREENGRRFKVQFLAHSGWIDLIGQPFWHPTYEYRIVELPAPEFVPFTRENCPVGSVVKNGDGIRFLIVECDSKMCRIGRELCLYDVLLESFTMEDGSPCGTEVTA